MNSAEIPVVAIVKAKPGKELCCAVPNHEPRSPNPEN